MIDRLEANEVPQVAQDSVSAAPDFFRHAGDPVFRQAEAKLRPVSSSEPESDAQASIGSTLIRVSASMKALCQGQRAGSLRVSLRADETSLPGIRKSRRWKV